ncbi:high-affinity iron permease [Physocladia obscura]|uniref:High-affinity iron permease n=1 Tax=Physocladia obscura TaxID=109957 RepID=A0AAD5SM62_9FUNG|nr:high-affinity iron permease [Physocladia obscura]
MSTIMMLVLSASLVSEIAGEVEEYIYEEIFDIDDGSTPVLWDLSGCCSEKKVPFFQVLNALVGWKARPTVATFGSYIMYWVVIISVIVTARLRVQSSRSGFANHDQEELQAAVNDDDDVDENAPLLVAASA